MREPQLFFGLYFSCLPQYACRAHITILHKWPCFPLYACCLFPIERNYFVPVMRNHPQFYCRKGYGLCRFRCFFLCPVSVPLFCALKSFFKGFFKKLCVGYHISFARRHLSALKPHKFIRNMHYRAVFLLALIEEFDCFCELEEIKC